MVFAIREAIKRRSRMNRWSKLQQGRASSMAKINTDTRKPLSCEVFDDMCENR